MNDRFELPKLSEILPGVEGFDSLEDILEPDWDEMADGEFSAALSDLGLKAA